MIKSIRIFYSILLSALVVMVFAVVNHWIKSEVIDREEHLETLEANIALEENRIMVLEADWAYLTRPSRIEHLSRVNCSPLRQLNPSAFSASMPLVTPNFPPLSRRYPGLSASVMEAPNDGTAAGLSVATLPCSRSRCQ